MLKQHRPFRFKLTIRQAGTTCFAALTSFYIAANPVSASEPINPFGANGAGDGLEHCRKWNDGTLSQWDKDGGNAAETA